MWQLFWTHLCVSSAGSGRDGGGMMGCEDKTWQHTDVATKFGESGLMREWVEAGETAHLFAPANMPHPGSLEAAGRGAPVALSAWNRFCALAAADLAFTSERLLDAMLSDEMRLGTSTPLADPSGDYASALFDRAEAVRPGATVALKDKAMQLTGGP